MLLEQIEDLHDYDIHYLPQMTLSGLVPFMILIVVFPLNWAAGLILFLTASLIPLFMALVGMGAAAANRRNFQALARLSRYFLDRLRGLETLWLFHAVAKTEDIRRAIEACRQRTMEVLRQAFLSSGVLEFFASISIAVAAVYFGFSYHGRAAFRQLRHQRYAVRRLYGVDPGAGIFPTVARSGHFYHAKAQV